MANAPNRYELYTLADGEARLTVEEDTKIPNACTVTINKEDHTLANMLRCQLLLATQVLFAGYKVPHPLEPKFIIKVQTDGTITPLQAVENACQGLILILDDIKNQMLAEFQKSTLLGPGL